MTHCMKVAVVQMASVRGKADNIRIAIELLKKAIGKKAEFIALPETFSYRSDCSNPVKEAEYVSGNSISCVRDLAFKNKVFILAGSICEKTSFKNKVYNSAVLVDKQGKIKDIYRKMHLFDVSLKHRKINESKIFLKGRTPVLTCVYEIKTGMAICYDVRFPEMFRAYSDLGAKMFCIPSSFTSTTGEAHWEILLKARAIENQCFVIAPNQCGTGDNGLKAYGNSMIIDPWGKILARASGDKEEIIYADLDFSRLDEIRKNFPVLKHKVL